MDVGHRGVRPGGNGGGGGIGRDDKGKARRASGARQSTLGIASRDRNITDV